MDKWRKNHPEYYYKSSQVSAPVSASIERSNDYDFRKKFPQLAIGSVVEMKGYGKGIVQNISDKQIMRVNFDNKKVVGFSLKICIENGVLISAVKAKDMK